MLTSLSHSFIYVLDHDEALEFYAGKLGLEIGADADLGPFRWVTVHVPGQPDSALVLATPDMGHDEETAAAIRELVTKGGGNGVIFTVEDCRKAYEALLEKGVEFTQEPTEHFYGIDCGLRGSVVAVQFCTYSCVNWIRTLPYVRAWAERYRDRGLSS